ncbi:cupin domain-containing protein, partial [Streptomyces sp. NPDC058964]
MPLTTTDYDNGGDLAKYTDSLIASKDSREPDWGTLSFQEKAGPQYKRAQIRYVGSGATGNHENDGRILPSGGFTFSN